MTSGEIATTDQLTPDLPPTPTNIAESWRLALYLSEAHGVIPKHLYKQPHAVFAVLCAAQALDIPGWTACQELYLVDGKISYSATLMRALIIRAGHVLDSITDDGATATVTATRRDTGRTHSASFGNDDATTAGLVGKDNWMKYPRAMRVARATSILARDYFPDVFAGMSSYTPEEVGGEPAPSDLTE